MVKERKTKFIAAKVNINENIFSDNKQQLIDLIPEAIKVKKEYQRNTWTWQFTDVDEEGPFIVGNLVKSRYETVDVVDGDKTEIFSIPKPVANKSRFLYHIENEVVIFEERELDRFEFITGFSNLVYRNSFKIGEIKINFIPKKDEILSKIRSMEILTKIEFDIIPPNMIEKNTFKGLNEIINDENATRMKTVFENKNGLNKDGDFIKEGIEMVSNAYGEVKAYGYNFEPRANKKGNKKVRTKYFSQDSIYLRRFETKDEDELFIKMKKFAIDMIKILL
ncbi:hypothetical protein [Bacillus sp. EB01]|uniref:hypothetical protein n=1 Tax=Bacillus sp. EB01 TaxID=1347086 RepID=UPI0005C6067E|nr:hypothetical protein [Bacillus sp. EB01]